MRRAPASFSAVVAAPRPCGVPEMTVCPGELSLAIQMPSMPVDDRGDGRRVEPEHGGHAARGLRGDVGHEARALDDELEPGLDRVDPRDSEGRELAQAVARDRDGRDARCECRDAAAQSAR